MLPSDLKELLNSDLNTLCTQPCERCIKNPCCKTPGYATYENTLIIYKLYKMNKLQREDDVTFKSDLSYKEFITTYFTVDPHPLDESFLRFHPKVIRNQEHNWGCVFCKRKIKDNPNDVYKNCMLWSEKRYTEISSLPIGCVNNDCTKEFAETRETLVHHHYPNSHANFTNTD